VYSSSGWCVLCGYGGTWVEFKHGSNIDSSGEGVSGSVAEGDEGPLHIERVKRGSNVGGCDMGGGHSCCQHLHCFLA
jgi:hypothetical protein